MRLANHLSPQKALVWCLAALFIIPDYYSYPATSSYPGGWYVAWPWGLWWANQNGWAFVWLIFSWSSQGGWQNGWSTATQPIDLSPLGIVMWALGAVLPLVLAATMVICYHNRKSSVEYVMAGIVSIMLLISWIYLDLQVYVNYPGYFLAPIEEFFLLPIVIFSFMSIHHPIEPPVTAQLKYCSECGAENSVDAQFCGECGAAILTAK